MAMQWWMSSAGAVHTNEHQQICWASMPAPDFFTKMVVNTQQASHHAHVV